MATHAIDFLLFRSPRSGGLGIEEDPAATSHEGDAGEHEEHEVQRPPDASRMAPTATGQRKAPRFPAMLARAMTDAADRAPPRSMVAAQVAGAARPIAAAPRARTPSAGPELDANIAANDPRAARTRPVAPTPHRLSRFDPVRRSSRSTSTPPPVAPATTPARGTIVISPALVSFTPWARSRNVGNHDVRKL